MSEVRYFMEKSETEQTLRLTERIPTLEEFYQYREGTSAVRVVLALNEYGGSKQYTLITTSMLISIRFCNETILSLEVLRNKDAAALWNLTNKNICMYVCRNLIMTRRVQRAARFIPPQCQNLHLRIWLITDSNRVKDLLSIKKELIRATAFSTSGSVSSSRLDWQSDQQSGKVEQIGSPQLVFSALSKESVRQSVSPDLSDWDQSTTRNTTWGSVVS